MPDSIILRKLELNDSPDLAKLANNPAITNDMVTLVFPFTEKDALDLIYRSKSEEEVVMAVTVHETGIIAGVIMLRDFEHEHQQAELSIWIGEAFWGKGYGTEAINLMTKHGFKSGLNRIYAYCMVRNIASQRILEKSGFTREGLLRERVFKNEVYEDVYIYAKLRKDE